MKERLQVILAHCGIASRRKSSDFIENGRVRVNGVIVKEKGFKVDSEKDEITVDGRPLNLEKKVYFVLNKPKGFITTSSDERGRATILDLIHEKNIRIYSVGRLDKDTEGVLLLTNDGKLSYKLTHPKFGVKKIYIAEIKGHLPYPQIKKLEKGVFLDKKKTSPCKIIILKKSQNKTELKIELHEGRKRQIHRMIEKIGCKVLRLKRIEYAGITTKDLRKGEYRPLREYEIAHLNKMRG